MRGKQYQASRGVHAERRPRVGFEGGAAVTQERGGLLRAAESFQAFAISVLRFSDLPSGELEGLLRSGGDGLPQQRFGFDELVRGDERLAQTNLGRYDRGMPGPQLLSANRERRAEQRYGSPRVALKGPVLGDLNQRVGKRGCAVPSQVAANLHGLTRVLFGGRIRASIEMKQAEIGGNLRGRPGRRRVRLFQDGQDAVVKPLRCP